MAGLKRFAAPADWTSRKRTDGVQPASRSTDPDSDTSTDTTDTTDTDSRQFAPDASVVLTGIPGVGKSTLAIMAASAMKRRVVDVEKAFQETSGLPSAAYKKTHGATAYSEQQSAVLHSILQRHATGAVIVCVWMERNVQAQLRATSATCPVVYVVREAAAIRGYLRLLDEARVRDLLDASGAVFRRCTQLEFFNVSETATDAGTTTYLTLKRAERHFVKFLSLVFPAGTMPFLESAFPLAALPAEERCFTYALSLPLSSLRLDDVDVEALDSGADLIELVVDLLPGSALSPPLASEITRVVGRLRRSSVIPLFYHVVFDETAPDLYLAYVRHGLRLLPEYLSVDLRLDDAEISRIAAARGPGKMVGSVAWTHGPAPPWTDSVWLTYYQKAQRLGCDLVRLTRKPEGFADNLDVAGLQQATRALGRPPLPLIAYNLGADGRHSACLNRVLTSVRPEGAELLWPGAANSLPALTAREATEALAASFAHAPRKLYVFGANVDYSVSPAMHNAALAACGMPHHYTAHSTTSIQGIQQLASDPDFGGASVGLPFKVEALSITDGLSRHARAIGAINTLIPVRRLTDDGAVPTDFLQTLTQDQAGPIRALYGENTDWVGIRACLQHGLSPANAVRSNSCALVVGAGGMARAAVYAVLQLGVKHIAVYNRTQSHAEALVAHFARTEDDADQEFTVIPWHGDGPSPAWPQHLRLPTMIVSCIPTHPIAGEPAPDFTLPPAWLDSPTGGVLFELAYKTPSTPLLKQGRQRHGWVTLDGLDLLPEQGFAQFELFTGRRAPRRVMRRAATTRTA